jgi:hypothetical protein
VPRVPAGEGGQRHPQLDAADARHVVAVVVDGGHERAVRSADLRWELAHHTPLEARPEVEPAWVLDAVREADAGKPREDRAR